MKKFLKKLFNEQKRTKITSFLLAVILLIVPGCSKNKDKDYDSYLDSKPKYEYDGSLDYENKDESSNEFVLPNIQIESNDEIFNQIRNVFVNYDEIDDHQMQSYLEGIMVDYNDSERFEINQALNLYSKVDHNTTADKKIIINNKVDGEKLYQAVINNNAIFKSDSSNKKYEALSESTIKQIVDIITDYFNEKLADGVDIDVDILNSTLSNLKIMGISNSFNVAIVDNKTSLLSIDLNMINNVNGIYEGIDAFAQTIEHECGHIGQAGYSDCFEANYGFCYKFPELEVNPLYNQWFFEGASERLHLDSVTDKAYQYPNEVKNIEALSLATLFDGGLTSIEELSLQKKLDKLFEKFDCQNQEDREEVIKMMFSLNIIYTTRNDYEKKYYQEYSDYNEFLGNLKSDVATTMTKYFYSNLSKLITNKSANLNDIFSLIYTFEIEMNRFLLYSDTSRLNTNAEFVEVYCQIQDMFFSLVECDEDVKVLYYQYCDRMLYLYQYDPVEYIDNTLLNNEEDSFVYYLLESRKNMMSKPIQYSRILK